ncbi:helix-turn-helix transcriptional regulator [Paenibacillus sp. HB172176]|uniref:helix-turn-helix transcriptional regulator n=1 Tax=Paenibacillus sp. HB172176 TaxID=2493690 RepID=UPI0014398DE8|nr:helix-turn-helix transcriptional regulator [Paenibacillus sp. HB172176]
MTAPVSYTTEEIAALLKVSKLTVYDLIKKGELASYRVGKQMRVDEADLEAYKQRSKGATKSVKRPVVITGQDISLDLLAKHMEEAVPDVRPLRAHVGSLDSLIAMYRGESDIVSTHLWDGETNAYNLPYIRKILVGSSYIVVNLLSRWAGLYVANDNPLGLKHWDDLKQDGLRIVNREKGSGARVLLDEQLRLHGIPATRLIGYGDEQSNHLGVASKVASGEADVGVGIEKAASIVGNVSFLPLQLEQYDLVLMKNEDNRKWIPEVLELLRSTRFRKELGALQSYDLSLTGQILYET